MAFRRPVPGSERQASCRGRQQPAPQQRPAGGQATGRRPGAGSIWEWPRRRPISGPTTWANRPERRCRDRPGRVSPPRNSSSTAIAQAVCGQIASRAGGGADAGADAPVVNARQRHAAAGAAVSGYSQRRRSRLAGAIMSMAGARVAVAAALAPCCQATLQRPRRRCRHARQRWGAAAAAGPERGLALPARSPGPGNAHRARQQRGAGIAQISGGMMTLSSSPCRRWNCKAACTQYPICGSHQPGLMPSPASRRCCRCRQVSARARRSRSWHWSRLPCTITPRTWRPPAASRCAACSAPSLAGYSTTTASPGRSRQARARALPACAPTTSRVCRAG